MKKDSEGDSTQFESGIRIKTRLSVSVSQQLYVA